MNLGLTVTILTLVVTVLTVWELQRRSNRKRYALDHQLQQNCLNASVHVEQDGPLFATIRKSQGSLVLRIYSGESTSGSLLVEQVFLSFKKLEEYLERETIFRLADFV